MWRCQSSGDCCRIPKSVVMTYDERKELEAVAHLALRPLRWRHHKDPRMETLVAQPCPFVTDDNRCAAYDVRPYACRRFGCMRADVSEPFHDVDTSEIARKNPSAFPMLMQLQHDAQPWAIAHGWRKDK